MRHTEETKLVCRDEILKHAPLYARVSAWVGG